MKTRIFAVALLILSAGIAVGQVLYGTLVGTVSDPQQAAVVGANVSLKNNATGYSVEAKTNDRGGYEIPNIRRVCTTSGFRWPASHRSRPRVSTFRPTT